MKSVEPELEGILRDILTGEDTIQLPPELTEEREKPPASPKSLHAQIQEMTVAQKIKLALHGNKEARTLLVRDVNSVVNRCVLQNPRLTGEEVVALAKNRNVHEELLRMVAENREWTKNYQVRLGLVENPRTPLAIALQFLPSLQERDMRFLAKSKNVPTTVSTQAKRLLLQKNL